MFLLDISDLSGCFLRPFIDNGKGRFERRHVEPSAMDRLRVRRVTAEEIPEVAKIANLWEQTASKLASTNALYREQLFDSQFINGAIVRVLRRDLSQNSEVYICETEETRIPQGLMIVSTNEKCPERTQKDVVSKDTCLKINWLATRPGNIIRSASGKRDPDQVKGAGRSLVSYAEKKAISDRYKGVFLFSMPGAVSFYQSLSFGFEQTRYGDEYMYKSVGGGSLPQKTVPIYLRPKFLFF